MRLLEYEAKTILQKYSLPLPQNEVVDAPTANSAIPLPVVIKSQVPIGGRSKAGGVVKVESKSGFEETVKELLKKPIRSYVPRVLLVEEKLNAEHEYYLSLLVDRDTASVQILAHPEGGVDVESADQKLLFRHSLHAEPDEQMTQMVLGAYGMFTPSEEITSQMQKVLSGLWNCLKDEDATLIEINPLVLTPEQKLVCGDCKMEVDDNAAFRHEWNFETPARNQNFVLLDPDGEVATLANGAGLAMATVDTAANAGLKVANFLDIGGGTNEATAIEALRTISQLSHVRAIIINIFAGITKSDEVASAVISAKQSFKDIPPLFIRIEGNRQDAARRLLEENNIRLYDSLLDCVDAAAKELIS